MPFEGLIRSCMDEEGISELEDLTVETSKTENQEKKTEQNNEISKDCGTVTKGVPYT